MKNPVLFILSSALFFTMVMASCGTAQTPTITSTPTEEPTNEPPTLTSTPDLCAPENIQSEVDKIHRHMREFDDASRLASSIPRDQLSSSIADLQRIRRAAEDEVTVPCLENLKKFQIQHMNLVIETLITFIGGNSDQAILDQGISLARQQHDQYVLELARILGLTPEIATAATIPTQTPTP